MGRERRMGDAGQQRIGPYAIIRLLNENPMGHTYLGKDEQRKKRYVILKVFTIPLTTKAAREAFLTHAKQLKKLKRSNITEIQDFGVIAQPGNQQNLGYLAIEYIENIAILQQFAAGKSFAPNEIKPFLSTIADTLQYAHVSHILHGNLHPGNILFGEELRLTDFSPVPQELLPLFEQLVTPALPYKAPEHLRGTPTFASDQYSLAVIIYEWLCGRRPYTATERETLLYQQEHEPIPAPRSLNSKISPTVETVLLKALSTEPADRFEHMLKFSDAYLRALMGFPFDENKYIERAQFIQHTPSYQPENTNATQIDDSDTNTIPTLSDESLGAPSIPPKPSSPGTANKQQIKAGKKNARPSPNEIDNDAIDEEEDEPETGEDEEEVMTTKWHKKRPKNSLRGQLSELHPIVTTDLGHGGILSERLPGYEERQAQIEMATLVARSLTEERHAIVEAATGTGKSLAYLLPIVRSGKVAIISTANKALQEQLFYKDIPFVQEHIQDFEAALVKGMGNYICLDRMDKERIETQPFLKNPDFTRLLNIVKEFELSITGDFETLGFTLPYDIRGRVSADSDQCAWRECHFFSRCYVRQMRDKAALSQVIVVNHTLLLLDAVFNGYLLPERDVIVVDEAHHLEEEATRAFTVTVSESRISALLAQNRLKQHSPADLQEEAKQTLMFAWDRLAQVGHAAYFKGRVTLQEPMEEGLRLATVISKLAEALRTQRPEYMEEPENTLYDKLITRTENLANDIRKVFSVDQRDAFVYYVEQIAKPGRRGPQLEISAAPLDVNTWLREHLFSKSNVICTSATLATVSPNPIDPEDRGPNFAYFRRRVGLDNEEYPDVLECILPHTFDYTNNAMLYLPRHLPEPVFGPDSNDYTNKIAQEMMRLVEASRGRAFLLFSSKRMLDAVYNIFLDRLPTYLDFDLLRQGDYNRIELVRRFRESKAAVLFGLKSFWEGIDIVGEVLSLVVIDKMPFDPPDDPVHEARVTRMKANGENWFGNYVLPQAVLRLKQGLGRLLRTHEDRGVMAILDARLHTKGYGKLVINALPPARRTDKLKDVQRFFEEDDGTPF
jgi:Rad3-related DNA helicase/serine/threonine protein kinase